MALPDGLLEFSRDCVALVRHAGLFTSLPDDPFVFDRVLRHVRWAEELAASYQQFIGWFAAVADRPHESPRGGYCLSAHELAVNVSRTLALGLMTGDVVIARDITRHDAANLLRGRRRGAFGNVFERISVDGEIVVCYPSETLQLGGSLITPAELVAGGDMGWWFAACPSLGDLLPPSCHSESVAIDRRGAVLAATPDDIPERWHGCTAIHLDRGTATGLLDGWAAKIEWGRLATLCEQELFRAISQFAPDPAPILAEAAAVRRAPNHFLSSQGVSVLSQSLPHISETPTPDGPVRPGGFRWQGNEKRGLTPLQFNILSTLWESMDGRATYAELAKNAWGDAGLVLDDAQVKNHLTPLRRFLRDAIVPFEIVKLKGEDVVVLDGPVPNRSDA